MWAAIGETVSSPYVWLLPIALPVVAFLGVLRLMAKGDAHKVESLKWKTRFLGELELTFRESDSSDMGDSSGDALPGNVPAWKRWWRRLHRRE